MTFSLARRMVFVRHGRTAYNAEGRLQGQRDVPLDGKGREQARAVGRYLRGAMGDEIARLDEAGAFWSSPLGRARETMEIARAAIGLDPAAYRLDRRLEELSFGDWEGLTWDEVETGCRELAKVRAADKWSFTPPGGESYAMLAERVTPWLEGLRGETLVVAHGGIARVFLALLAGAPPGEAASAEIWQGRALILDQGRAQWVG